MNIPATFYKRDEPLMLRPLPNGGWVIDQPKGPGFIPQEIGAYSNTADMLEALNAALLAPPTEAGG